MRYHPHFAIYPKCLLSALFLIFFLPALAQDSTAVPPTAEESRAELSRELSALVADVLPRFPGGDERMADFITTYLAIPYVDLRNDSAVIVYVDFMVERSGYLADVKIKYPGIRALDKEVVRLFSTMPRWNPGQLNGKPVDLRMTLPLRITLPNTIRKPADVPTPSVSSLPQFKGGGQALRYHIRKNMRYPQEAKAAGIKGAVTVEFLILANGNVGNPVTIGEAIGYGLEEEAMRIVEKMPRWIPAKLDGKAVSTKHQIVIRFEPPGTPAK